MTPPVGDRRRLTWRELFIYIALPLIAWLGGFMVHDIYANISSLREHKIDKQEHYRDIQSIKEYLQGIREDLKTHEQNSRKRSGD